MPGTRGEGVAGPGEAPPVSFAPEAHLPAERRLIIDRSGLTLEGAFGIQHRFVWAQCASILIWSDRAELVFDGEVSLVVRSGDWYRGANAVAAIADMAPPSLVVPMLDDPEEARHDYVLRGLAASGSPVLIVLAFALMLVAAIGVGVGIQDRRSVAAILGLAFGVAAAAVLQALYVRYRVPMRFRTRAAVRGKAAVKLDARIAGAADAVLERAELVLYAVTVASLGLLVSSGTFVLLVPVASFTVGLAVRRERRRRRRRREDAR